MKIKKRYLLAAIICGMQLLLYSNNTAIAMNLMEIALLRQIEGDRHNENKSLEVCNALHGYIQDSTYSQNFRVYCLSIAIKIMENSQLQELLRNLPSDLDCSPNTNSCYFNLFYRCINKQGENLSSYNSIHSFITSIINSGIEFLLEGNLDGERFKKYDDINKLYILKSLCALNGRIEKSELTRLENQLSVEIPNLTTADENLNVKVLLTYAKIPGKHQKTKGVEAINAIFKNLANKNFKKFSEIKKKDFSEITKKKCGQEALLTFARIPGHTEEQIVALEALKEANVSSYGKKISQIAYSIRKHATDLSSTYSIRLDNLCATFNYVPGWGKY